MPALPPYRLLFNNDSTNIGGCISPWRLKGQPISDERISASIAEAAAAGADCVTLAPGLGWIPWWKSTIYPDHYRRWQARTGLPLDQYGRYMQGGGDMVATHLATCRRLGIGCFVSLRLNDVHMQDHYADQGEFSVWVSEFYRGHLDCQIDPDHVNHKGYYGTRGLDWSKQPVREHKLALIAELAGYDVDGIELDFLRDDHLFAEAVPIERRIAVMTEVCAQVRQLLDAGHGRARHRWLSVRIPIDPARHAQSGIDVARFHASGVDIFNCSGWYDTTQRTDAITHIRNQAPGAASYAELTHSAGYHPYFLSSIRYGTSGNPRCSDRQLYTTAHQALSAGAHGISLFNFVYYRQIEGAEANDAICCEPPFHALRHLLDRDFLERQPAHYHLGGNGYLRQVPQLLAKDGTATFHVELASHRLGFGARMRFHTRAALPPGAVVTVDFNGTRLEPQQDPYRHFGNPFDPLISPPGHRRAFLVPLALLRPGLNDVVLHSCGAEDMEVIYLDLGIDAKDSAASLQDWTEA